MMDVWATLPSGETLYKYTLTNARGMSVGVTNYGAIVTHVHYPIARGRSLNCVLGYESAKHYIEDKHFIGVVAGRYCNRIAGAAFELNGERYPLFANEGPNQLHGGDGFSKRVWQCTEQSPQSLTLQLVSPDGDQGYPGTLTARVIYTLTDDNELIFEWTAHSDRDTMVSLTNHSYFNLDGAANVKNHRLQIHLDAITPINADGIPTGDIAPVNGSIFDFRSEKRLTNFLGPLHKELGPSQGFDHNWCRLDGDWDGSEQRVASLASSQSGLRLNVYSTLPGLQYYTGNFLHETGIFDQHQAICLETQYYPNAPNEPAFPSPILRAGDTMRHRTRFEFALSP